MRTMGYYQGTEIEVTFSGRKERSDYGVSGSPVWTDYADVKVEDVYVLGVALDLKTLPQALIAELMELLEEADWDAE